jgi:hypothetical protein
MKNHLMAGGAALLLSTIGASAGPTWVQLNGSADVFAITQQQDLFAQVHYHGDLIEGMGVGMAAKTWYISKGVMLTDSFQYGDGSYVCYDFQRPFKTGGHWVAYSTLNGRKVQWLGSGTYTVIPGWLGQ